MAGGDQGAGVAEVRFKDRTAQLWCENATRLTGELWQYGWYHKARENNSDTVVNVTRIGASQPEGMRGSVTKLMCLILSVKPLVEGIQKNKPDSKIDSNPTELRCTESNNVKQQMTLSCLSSAFRREERRPEKLCYNMPMIVTPFP